jgi:hypothetical protein
MRVVLAQLICGRTLALTLSAPTATVSTAEERLPKLIDVKNVPDVIDALRNGYKQSNVTQPTLQAWRAAQLRMFEQTDPIWRWQASCRKRPRLYDDSYFGWFQGQMQNDVSFYTGSIYIPIPWRQIVEDGAYTFFIHKESCPDITKFERDDGLKMAYDVLMSLDPSFTYFTVMSQSHVGQIVRGERSQKQFST